MSGRCQVAYRRIHHLPRNAHRPVYLGQKILIVGCDPKADCIRLILNSEAQDTVLQLGAKQGSVQALELGGISRQLPLELNQIEWER